MPIATSSFSNTLSTVTGATQQQVADELFTNMATALTTVGITSSYQGYIPLANNPTAVGGRMIILGQNVGLNDLGNDSISFYGYNSFGGAVMYGDGTALFASNGTYTYNIKTVTAPNGGIYCTVQIAYNGSYYSNGVSFSKFTFKDKTVNDKSMIVNNWITPWGAVFRNNLEYPNSNTLNKGVATVGMPIWDGVYYCDDLICIGSGALAGYTQIVNTTPPINAFRMFTVGVGTSVMGFISTNIKY